MATIQEQLENAVAIYNKCANKVNTFINGGDTETIESNSGNKPTLAKIVKDTQDVIAGSIDEVTNKATQVATNTQTVEDIKIDVQVLRDEMTNIFNNVGDSIGQFSFFATENIPNGWLRCDGSIINKNTYPDLVSYLNNNDELAETAILPNAIHADGRGRFLRDIGLNGSPLDVQEDELKSHNHNISVRWNDHNTWGGIDGTSASSVNTLKTEDYGGEETRPISLMGVLCIKAFHGVINTGNIDITRLASDVQYSKGILEYLGQEIELWSGIASNNAILTLEEDIINFKYLIFKGYNSANINSKYHGIVLASQISVSSTQWHRLISTEIYYCDVYFTTLNTIKLQIANSSITISNIIGIK